MSKFKRYEEQKLIKHSDFNLATTIKFKNVILSEVDRTSDIVELKKLTNIFCVVIYTKNVSATVH